MTFWSCYKWRFRQDIIVTIMRFIVLIIRLMEDVGHVCEGKDEFVLVDPVMDCSMETCLGSLFRPSLSRPSVCHVRTYPGTPGIFFFFFLGLRETKFFLFLPWEGG